MLRLYVWLAGVGGVHALKVLTRQTRGNTVKDFHGLLNLKRVQFAEQLQVTPHCDDCMLAHAFLLQLP